MSEAPPTTQPRDPAYGWVMVFAVFLLSALAFGALGSISVFLKPLVTEFGWSRGQTSFGYTVISFSSAVFGVLWGYIADRFGTRWFGLIAAFAMSGSLFALSQQASILQFYGLYFLFGAFGNAMVTSPLFANVGFWFTHKPGLALGITASGGAVGQAVVPYLCAVSLELYGWQTTYMLSAACYLALALPVALLIRESPGREQARLQLVDEERTFPLSEREVIIWISVAIIFCCTCMSVPIVHLVPLLTDSGFSLDQATTVLMVLMFSGALGRILGGAAGGSDRCSAQLYCHVGGPDVICVLVSFFGFDSRDIFDRRRLWLYLFRCYVCDFGVYANDGFGQIRCPCHEHNLVFRLVRHGGGRIYGGVSVRSDRQLRPVVYRRHGGGLH